MMHGLVEFGQQYPGGQQDVFMGDVFTAIGELRTEGIEPGSPQYREQLAHMADSNLFDTSELTTEPDVSSRAQQAGNALQESLAHHKRELDRASGPYADENEVLRLERTISKIESDIQRMNGSVVPPAAAPDKPVLSPEAQARQDKADKDYYDSVARADAAQRDGPQDYEQSEIIDDGDDFDPGDYE
ncbi:MAG: hypothetical protein GY703_14490 [Gammaproteobacteria bacterium]|nr:hypothetical protein [Gammaproteobacteria bacterium]